MNDSTVYAVLGDGFLDCLGVEAGNILRLWVVVKNLCIYKSLWT